MRHALSCFIVAGTAAFAASVHAETKPFFTTSGLLTVATDGMSKDVSESDNGPQVVGYVQAAHGPFFAGFKLKNVKNSDGSDSQQEFSIGAKGTHGAYQFGLQTAYKIKVGAVNSQNEYFEWKGDISRAFGDTTAKLEVEYSPDSSGSTKQAIWLDASLSRKLNTKWSVLGGFGARRLTPARDYNSFHMGVVYALTARTSFDLRYYDTDRHEYGDKNKAHLVLRLSQKL